MPMTRPEKGVGPSPADDKPRGDTQPSQQQQKRPRLPHEHDESSDSQKPTDNPTHNQTHNHTHSQSDAGKQAFDDLENGLVDTDRGPVLEKLQEREK